MNFFQITKEEINPQEIIERVKDRNAGAINLFIGTVRELTHEKKLLLYNTKLMKKWLRKN